MIGLALGSGSARGWAHIGVINELRAAGIHPDLVCGTSIGALVGAVYAEGGIDALEEWVSSLTWPQVVGFFDVSFVGGLIKGNRLMEFFRKEFLDRRIEDLPLPFAAVATELDSGREVWLREGPVTDALRASIATPGLFTPRLRDGHLLVDGALVNPVPVSLCRAMGANLVIAVDLSHDISARTAPSRALSANAPSLVNVVTTCLNIMQVRLTRSRLAGEPADVLIAPHLERLGLLEYHRAREAIEAGRAATLLVLPQLRLLIERVPLE